MTTCFAVSAIFRFLRDAWIRTKKADATAKRTINWATHLFLNLYAFSQLSRTMAGTRIWGFLTYSWTRPCGSFNQRWGSVTFWCGSGFADPYLWLMDSDPTPDPTPFFSDLRMQKTKQNSLLKFLLKFYFTSIILVRPTPFLEKGSSRIRRHEDPADLYPDPWFKTRQFGSVWCAFVS